MTPSKNRRTKGKNFETKIAEITDKICNHLILPNKSEQLKVKRSPFSGASKNELGDIDLGIYRQNLPKLVIECKKWTRLNFNNSLFKVLNEVNSIWNGYKEQYGNLDLVLVFAANYGLSYAFTDVDLDIEGKIKYKNCYLYVYEDFIKTYIVKYGQGLNAKKGKKQK